LPLDNRWNGGKMEYWVSKADDSLILISDQCHQYKIRSHSAIRGVSAFQHSTIPSFRAAYQDNVWKNMVIPMNCRNSDTL
jgi:hypothetical protein